MQCLFWLVIYTKQANCNQVTNTINMIAAHNAMKKMIKKTLCMYLENKEELTCRWQPTWLLFVCFCENTFCQLNLIFL